ncbi:MAG TPA: hypothetical protein EYP06_08330 [Desulfobacterales bacterium]|nr:hypothetical protein [Desulfobacterales bacterium]
MVLCSDNIITTQDLPEELIGAEAELDVDRFVPLGMPLPKAMERIEESLIRRALSRCNNVQAHAANMLGITKSLMQHKLKKYNIRI